MREITIDIGYSFTKVHYEDESGKDHYVKFNTAIARANKLGIDFGSENVYEYKGERYYCGKEALGDHCISSDGYEFIRDYSPIIIYHILKEFHNVDIPMPITVNTGLSLKDWKHKDEFIEVISEFTVNDTSIKLDVSLTPQGDAVYWDWVENQNNGKHPHKVAVIDIGHNTVNFLYYTNGEAVKRYCKSYPSQGLTSITKPFKDSMEAKYGLNFSEQELLHDFAHETFTYQGKEVKEVIDEIIALKEGYMRDLPKVILQENSKLLSFADKVVMGGGGMYLFEDVDFPPNTVIISKPYEFSNVRGYRL